MSDENFLLIAVFVQRMCFFRISGRKQARIECVDKTVSQSGMLL